MGGGALLNIGSKLAKNSRVTNALIGAGLGAGVGFLTDGTEGAISGAAIGAVGGATLGHGVGNALARTGVSMKGRSYYNKAARVAGNLGDDKLLTEEAIGEVRNKIAKDAEKATRPSRQREQLRSIRKDAYKQVNGGLREAKTSAAAAEAVAEGGDVASAATETAKVKQPTKGYRDRERFTTPEGMEYRRILDPDTKEYIYQRRMGGAIGRKVGSEWTTIQDVDLGARAGLASSKKTTVTASQAYGKARAEYIKYQEGLEKAAKKAGGVAQEAAEAAADVAEEISQTAVLDASGITGWMSEHPLATAGGAVLGGIVLANIFDDD